MPNNNTRRIFLKNTAYAGLAFAFNDKARLLNLSSLHNGKRIGIIGLDTSHSTAFVKALNQAKETTVYKGYSVTTAYPYGSKSIPTSYNRIEEYTNEVKEHGVVIASSIDELLNNCDVVMLETNDGTLHVEQAKKVFKSGKKVFIDKPVAAKFGDVIEIYRLSKMYKAPMFSASSLRYIDKAQLICKGNFGKVVGATTFSPATTEKSHTPLFWYGIHGVELLFTVMGTGCVSVQQTTVNDTDVVIGTWNDGRIGVFRGMRNGKHDYGGIVHTTEATVYLDKYDGYNPLLIQIINFFETGILPVHANETLEIYAFMDAAAKSKKNNGAVVKLQQVRI